MRFVSPLGRLLALVASLAALPAAAQSVLYVDADASGADNGSSWADAFDDLNDALVTGVRVLGGFTGTETSANQRTLDPDANGTVLSGDIGVVGDDSDNVYHVVTAVGVNSSAVLDGFLVTGGNADGGAPNERGGGLTNYDGLTTGADTEGTPTLRNVLFEGNAATFGGGVYLNVALGPVAFEDVEFKENVAHRGGGLYANQAELEVTGAEFEGNRAEPRSGTGTSAQGGGAFLVGGTSEMRGVEFDSNEVVGGESGRGGGLYVRRQAEVDLVDAVFERNRAEEGEGGGLYVESGSVRMANATLIGNVAASSSALFSTGSSDVTVTNGVVVGNRDVQSADRGVITTDARGALALTNTTVASNDAAAIYASGGTTGTAGATKLANVILWDNRVSFQTSADPVIEVEDAIIEGGFAGGENVLTGGPLFAASPDAGADGEWGTEDDDYGDLRLGAGSPALDAGDTDNLPEDDLDLDGDGVTDERLPVDLDGAARVQGAGVDFGPYESVAAGVSTDRQAGEPADHRLSASIPNPTRGRATLTLSLEAAGPAEVGVYDLLGRRVASLHAGPLATGDHVFEVDAGALPAGVYVVRAATASGTAMRRLTVVR